ncbi:ATP-binding cassette domain-containing protein [Rhodobacterales bacterium HKCCE2091]|nr:ATP-binding cassette domain-containing protein [Rhodobacterales bacterium HKCCE2091]
MIEIRNLHLARGSTAILHGITATIPAHGITALIGPNGAGKSTLLHAIAGLTAPTSGRVAVGGDDVHRMRAEDRARRLAVLTQSQAMTARLTVGELLTFGRLPHHKGRPGPADRAAVAASLAAFDLGTLADRPLDALSGGQRQRAFVAMAHAQTTPWMLLDEPLAALDPRYARDIMERLHRLTRPGDGGRAVVIVLHDLAMAARYADRILALKDGRVAGSGPTGTAFSTEALSALYDTSLKVACHEGRPLVLYD